MAKTLTVYLAADLKKFNQGIDDAGRKAQGLGGTLTNLLGPALIGAGAAAGALAIKLGVDGVKAATDDEAAASKLAQTLENLGLAHDTAPVEEYISSLERSLGVADDELRPAYDRLVRSIGDTEGANRALALALNVSAGTGKSLDTVVQALGRAYDGNTAGLSRLGAGLDKTTLQTGDMDAITGKLAATFGGQAQTSAQTFAGQIGRLSQAADNLEEAFGAGLLKALGDTNGRTQSLVDAMEDLEPTLERVGEGIGRVISTLADSDGLQVTLVESADNAGVLAEALSIVAAESANAADGIQNYTSELPGTNDYSGPIGGSNLLIDVLKVLNGWYRSTRGEAAATIPATEGLGTSLYRSAVAAERAVPGFASVQAAIDDVGDESVTAAVKVMSLEQALGQVGKGTFNWRREINGATDDAENFSIELNYNAYLARINAAAAAAAANSTRDYGGSTSSAATGTEKLTKAQREGIAAYERQDQALGETRKSLQAAMSDLDAATAKWKTYFDGISGGLQKGLGLAAAYEGQFTKEGEKTGVSLLEGFNRQVAQVEWFGNVLTAMKAQGADAGFISEVASLGPGVGGALGQQLIDDGLVPTLSAKWVNAQTLIADKAAGIVPEFLTAGVNSAADLVTGFATQAKAESENLTKLGKAIAKPVGQGFKAEILDAVADALAKAEEARSAAAARAAATRAAERIPTTEQQVATALNNIIGRADARTGRPQPNVPFLVLG